MTSALRQPRRHWCSSREKTRLASFPKSDQTKRRKTNSMRRRFVDQAPEDRPRRRRRESSCECYCKSKETNDESSLLSSQKSTTRNIEKKREKVIEPTTMINLDIKSPDREQFKANVLESPTLSPDTQNAIENAEKILEEVRYKIIEATQISSTGFSRRIEKYTDDLEPPLEDEIDENLYIRELVSSKLNKMNNQFTEDSDISTDRNMIVNNKVTKKRSVNLLAPKFRTMGRRFNDILYQPKNQYCTPFEQIKPENSKFVVSNEIKNDDLQVENKTHKTKSLTIQKGPPLNIDRKLKKQDLGFVHISPDTSFIQQNTNINVYSFSHESCKKKDMPLKSTANEPDEKFIDNVTTDVIDELDRSTSKNQKITEEIQISEENSSAKSEVGFLTDVVGRKDDPLFEGSINNGRVKKDRGNVSEHLPRTGVDYFTLNEEANSHYSNDVRKTEENLHYEGRKIIKNIDSRDVVANVQNSSNKDGRICTIKCSDDDKKSDCYKKRTDDNIIKIDNDIKQCRKKKITDRVNSAQNTETIHDRDLNKELHNVIEKHDLSSKISSKTNKFSIGKESTDLSDNSLQETDITFNDIELNAPSIETFDNILSVYDKIIDRVSKSERKIEDTLTRLEFTLSNELLKPVISNTEVKSYDLIKKKKNDNVHNINKNGSMLLLSHESKSMVVECKDKFEMNSCMPNDILKKKDSIFSKTKCDFKNKSHSIKKRNREINDIIRFGESTRIIDNIPDENKTELKHKIKVLSSDENLENVHAYKNDTHVERLFLKNEERREKKCELERTIVNSLSNRGHSSSILEEIIKHLQTFSNTRNQDIPTIFKNFVMDIMNRESGLIFDFSPIQKQDDSTTYTSRLQNGSSLQAIAQDGECNIQKNVITKTHVLQESPQLNEILYNSDRMLESKENSLKVCPLSSIKIEPTRHLIDELNQTEIEVLEKGTQYEVLCEQNVLESHNKIIKDVHSDENGAEDIVEEKITMDKYSVTELEINNADITKLDSIINSDTEKKKRSSETNIISTNSVNNAIIGNLYSNPSFSENIHKLSDSEDCSSHTNMSNIKHVNTNVTRFTTTSSETSHSEGELYLPSSCSYSLGEVRIVKNSTSMCNHALLSTSTLTYLDETASLLRHSSGEIYIDSSDTL